MDKKERNSNIRIRICKQCGKSFNGGPRAWYCLECRKEREKIRVAGYRRNGVVRHLGSTDICVVCGQPYIVLGGKQKYCKNCSEDAIKEVDRQQGLDWYHNNLETYNLARNIARHRKKVCVICGTEFPCNGTCRNTCSDECRKTQRREFQKKADDKRKGRRRG